MVLIPWGITRLLFPVNAFILYTSRNYFYAVIGEFVYNRTNELITEVDMSGASEWLLDGPAWVTYRTRLDLQGQPENDRQVQSARRAMNEDPALLQLIRIWATGRGRRIKSHKTTLLYHKLGFLADVGFRYDDEGIRPVVEKILAHQSPEGPFTVPISIPKVFGGDGLDHQTWMLTDAPLLLSALIRLGLGKDERA